MSDTQYIHAEKNNRGSFDTYDLSSDLSTITDNYEYGDVKEGNYQIWEFPSGKIFVVKSDRVVADKDYYSPPGDSLWLPELIYIRTDQDLVEKAHDKFNDLPKKGRDSYEKDTR